MPAIPEFDDIKTSERSPEVLRGLYAKEIRGSHRHQRITGEIEKEIEAVTIEIDQGVLQIRLHPEIGIEMIKTGSQSKFIDGSQKDLLQSSPRQIHIVFSRKNPVHISNKALTSINGAGSQHRKEKIHVEKVS